LAEKKRISPLLVAGIGAGAAIATGVALYLITRAEAAPPGEISFNVYLTGFPPEYYAQYPGWYVMWYSEIFGQYTDWHQRITVTTDNPTGRLYVSPGSRLSPTYTFKDGGSYYFNWETQQISVIWEP